MKFDLDTRGVQDRELMPAHGPDLHRNLTFRDGNDRYPTVITTRTDLTDVFCLRMVDPDRVRCAIGTTHPERRAERCPTLPGPDTKGQDSGGGPTRFPE